MPLTPEELSSVIENIRKRIEQLLEESGGEETPEIKKLRDVLRQMEQAPEGTPEEKARAKTYADTFLGRLNIWRLIKKTLYEWFVRFIKDAVYKGISTAVSVGFMWGFHGCVRLFPKQAIKIAQFVAKTYYTPPREWVGYMKEYIERLSGRKITQEQIQRIIDGHGDLTLAEVVGETFLKPMLGLILPDYPVKPEDGLKAAERFLGVNLQFQMSAWLLHMLGDMVSFGTFKSLKDLPNAIAWSYGIGWLSWLVMGTPFRKGISDPLEQYWNREYRPTLYTMSQLCRLKTAGLITDKEFEEQALLLGYELDKAYNLWIDSMAEFSDTDLRDLYYEGAITKGDVIHYLRRRGYHKTRAEAIATLITTDRSRKLRQSLVDELLRAYREDRVTESQVRQTLRDEGWTDTDIDLALSKERFIRGHRRELSVSQTKELLDWGLITREEYHRRLQRMGYDPTDIELLEALENAKKEREEIMRQYWIRYSQLQQALSRAGVENWWYALGELRGHELEIGKMSDAEWRSYMRSFIEAHGGKLE